MKESVRKFYKGIWEAYKFYGAIGPNGLIASIGTNVFAEILSNVNTPECWLVDENLLKMSEADLEFVATNAGTKMKNP